jgi:protease II
MYRKDLIRFGGAGSPVLLEGYGAYGIAIDPFFDANRLSILDRSVRWPWPPQWVGKPCQADSCSDR